jgi:hypothetical protein
MDLYIRHLYIRHLLAIPFLAALVVQQPADKTGGVSRQGRTRLETVWNTAYSRGDADALAPLLADDLIITMTDMAQMTKAQSVALLGSVDSSFSDAKRRIFAFGFTETQQFVTGRLQRAREINGHNADDKRFTKVYVRHAGKWVVVAWHASTTSV